MSNIAQIGDSSPSKTQMRKCQLCTRVFPRKWLLDRHVHAVHFKRYDRTFAVKLNEAITRHVEMSCNGESHFLNSGQVNNVFEFAKNNGLLGIVQPLAQKHSIFESEDQAIPSNTNGSPKIKALPVSQSSPVQVSNSLTVTNQQNAVAFNNGTVVSGGLVAAGGANALTIMQPTSTGLSISSVPQVLSVPGTQQLIQSGSTLVPVQTQPQQVDLIPVMDVNGNVFFAKSFMGGLVKNVIATDDQHQQQQQQILMATLSTSQPSTGGQAPAEITSQNVVAGSSNSTTQQQTQTIVDAQSNAVAGALNQQLLIHQLNPTDQQTATIFNGAANHGSIAINPNVIGTTLNPVLASPGVSLAQTLQWIPLTNADGSTTFVPTTVNPPIISSVSSDSLHHDPNHPQLMSNNLLLTQSPQLSIIASDPTQITQINPHLGDLTLPHTMVNVARLSQHHTASTNGSLVKDFPCSHCESTFSRKQYLNSHMAQFHRSNEHPYVCQLCNKGFARKWDFCRHINSVHRGNPMDAVSPRNLELVKNWMKDRGLYEKVVIPWLLSKGQKETSPRDHESQCQQASGSFHDTSADSSSDHPCDIKMSESLIDGSRPEFTVNVTEGVIKLTNSMEFDELGQPVYEKTILPDGLDVNSTPNFLDERPRIVGQMPITPIYGELVRSSTPTSVQNTVIVKMDDSSASDENGGSITNHTISTQQQQPQQQQQIHSATLVPTT